MSTKRHKAGLERPTCNLRRASAEQSVSRRYSTDLYSIKQTRQSCSHAVIVALPRLVIAIKLRPGLRLKMGYLADPALAATIVGLHHADLTALSHKKQAPDAASHLWGYQQGTQQIQARSKRLGS